MNGPACKRPIKEEVRWSMEVCCLCPFPPVLSPVSHRTLKLRYPFRSIWANSLISQKRGKIGPERESNFFKVTQHFKGAELEFVQTITWLISTFSRTEL